MKWGERLIESFTHDGCLVCGSLCDDLICEDCKKTLDSEKFDSYMVRCSSCFYPLISLDYVCPRCKNGSFPLYCVADYNSNLSYSLLHRFKFLNDKKIAKIIAMYLQNAIDVIDSLKSSYVVPIPCSKESLKRRGWDQMIEVARFLNRPVLNILKNINESDSQQKLLDRKERLEKEHKKRFAKISGYNISKEEASKTSVIVVDDVTTTSSTIKSAANCLREIGFEDIKAAVWLYDYKV